jgi:hypothetical protein
MNKLAILIDRIDHESDCLLNRGRMFVNGPGRQFRRHSAALFPLLVGAHAGLATDIQRQLTEILVSSSST